MCAFELLVFMDLLEFFMQYHLYEDSKMERVYGKGAPQIARLCAAGLCV